MTYCDSEAPDWYLECKSPYDCIGSPSYDKCKNDDDIAVVLLDAAADMSSRYIACDSLWELSNQLRNWLFDEDRTAVVGRILNSQILDDDDKDEIRHLLQSMIPLGVSRKYPDLPLLVADGLQDVLERHGIASDHEQWTEVDRVMIKLALD